MIPSLQCQICSSSGPLCCPQVLNAAWEAGIPVASENALPCYDRNGFNKILLNAKPRDDPDQHHLSGFTYLRLSNTLMEPRNLREFAIFVARMHGESFTGKGRRSEREASAVVCVSERSSLRYDLS